MRTITAIRRPGLSAGTRSHSRLLVAAFSASLVLAGCSGGTTDGSGAPAATEGASEGEQKASIRVVAAFYPLAHAVAQVGGSQVRVDTLAAPGAEPHDLELTPAQVREVQTADMVVYLSGFQPAVDQAVSGLEAPRLLDAAAPAALPTGDRANDHDRHFWLDPTLYGRFVDYVADQLATKDSAHAADYRRRAQEYHAQLTALDQEFRTGLTNCASKELVTSHEAFGFLAKAYGMNQVGIAGISPEQEPDPATMAKVVQTVRRAKVNTVYSETLVSPALADAVAKEAGAKVAVLDPIEGLTPESAGQDYLSIMHANLKALRSGQRCP